jgi:hypothetical protein
VNLHIAGGVTWRLEYRNMSSPAARVLVSGINDPGGVFALFGKVGRSPRVFAARDKDGFLRCLQTAALKKMGMTVAGDCSRPPTLLTEFDVLHVLELCKATSAGCQRVFNLRICLPAHDGTWLHIMPTGHALGV